MSKVYAVDLFSGAGGLSLGFLQTQRVNIIAAVENNKNAQKTYKRNHPGVPVYGDIRTLDYKEIIQECYNLGGKRINLVFGGPPCQGFSNANRQKTELISTNNHLVKDYVKAIEELKPDAFVMENVKAMKSSKHKFFYSSKDEALVNDLELSISKEKITLGKSTVLTMELVEFLQQAIYENLSLEDFVLKDEVLFSKISHLSRKEKEFNKYFESYKGLFNKTIPVWGNMHKKYWSNSYQEKWTSLGDQISNCRETSFSQILDTIREIIEVQKILIRLQEVMSNGIDKFKLDSDHRNVFLEVNTYNVLDYLLAKFKSLGYRFNESNFILNAAHFGAPQFRERLFIIGVKSEIAKDLVVELPESIYTNDFNTVRDAIADLVAFSPTTDVKKENTIKYRAELQTSPLVMYLNANVTEIHNHIVTETRPNALMRFGALQPGQNFHHLDESLKQTYSDPRRTQNTVYLRLNYDCPSGTVLNVRKSMWVHPEKTRAISIREAARLQTFPDDFVFEGPKDSQYQQIGNAVPPILGRAVAEKVLSYLGIPVDDALLLSTLLNSSNRT